MKSIPPSSSATRATTATAFATTWRSEASNPSSRRDRTVTRQSNTIGKPTSGATSSSGASIASSNSGASPPDTRKPPELTFRCYASQQRNSGSQPSTRPRPQELIDRYPAAAGQFGLMLPHTRLPSLGVAKNSAARPLRFADASGPNGGAGSCHDGREGGQ